MDNLFELEVQILDLNTTEELNLSEVKATLLIADLKTTMQIGEPVTFHLPEIEPEIDIVIELNYHEDQLGSLTTSFQSLWEDQLLGKITREFKISEILSITLQAALTDLNQNSKIAQPPQTDCPYLQKILKAQQYEKEAQEVLSRLRTEIGDFLGTVEEDGLKSGTRSPIRSGSRSPTKSVRSGRSPAAGGMSPYKRRGGERATLRAEDLPDINIPSRFALEFRKLSSEEVVGLKNLIIALSEKLRLMRLQVDEIENFQKEIKACESAQDELNSSMKETKLQVHTAQANLERYSQELEYQGSRAEENAQQHETRIQGLQEKLDGLLQELEEAKKENVQLKGGKTEDIDAEIARYKEEYQHSERNRQALQDKLQHQIEDFQKNQSVLAQQRQDVFNEKINLEQQLEELTAQTDKLQLENSQYQAELTKLKAQNHLEEHLRQKLQLTQAVGYQQEEDAYNLRDVLEELRQRHDDYMKQASVLENSMFKDSKVLKATAESLQTSINEKDSELNELKDQAKTLKDNLTNLEKLYHMKQDLERTYKRLKNSNKNIREAKDNVVSELSWVADYFLLQTRSSLAESRIHSRVKTIWDQKNFELEALQHSVEQEKLKNPIYIPLKGDIVDEALAEYLNFRDEMITVPFIREAPEVYLFGTKRIWLKFEKGKLSARVGGGFLPIEDFIEAYTDVEAEKFEYKYREISLEEKKFMGKFVQSLVGENSPKSPKKIREEIEIAVRGRDHATAYGILQPENRSRGNSPDRTRESPSRAIRASPQQKNMLQQTGQNNTFNQQILGQQNQQNVQSLQQQQSEQELQQILQSFSQQLTPNTAEFKFKSVFLNQIPPGMDVQNPYMFRTQTDVQTNQVFQIEANLFEQAMNRNPDPQKFYPYQVNGTEGLLRRVQQIMKHDSAFQAIIQKIDTDLKSTQGEMNGEITDKIKKVRENQSAMFSKLCMARIKLERLLDSQHRLSRDSGLEMKLRGQIDSMERKADLSGKIQKISYIELPQRPDIELDQQSVTDISQVLQKQRDAINELKQVITKDLKAFERLSRMKRW